MMKKLKILMLLPLFALAACAGGKGAEVKEEKAKEVAQNISNEQKNVKNLDFKMEMSLYDAKEKSSETTTYSYKVSENGDTYVATSGSDSEGKSSSTYYRVKNDKYEEVIYYASSTTSDNVTSETKACYGKKGNELVYTTISASIGTASVTTVQTIYSAVDPIGMINSSAKDAERGYDVKYYSSGDKNLTIEIKYNGKGQSTSDDAKVKNATATYTYENGLFAKATVFCEYENGDKMDNKYEAKYSGVKISLPSGWEDLINKTEE